jgi:hypothetical protein
MPNKFKRENYYKTSEVARLAGDLPAPFIITRKFAKW